MSKRDVKPTEQTMVQQAGYQREAVEQMGDSVVILERIREKLGAVAGHVPAEQVTALEASYHDAEKLTNYVERARGLLIEAHGLLDGALTVAKEAMSQRDLIADDLSALVLALESLDTKNQTVRRAVDTVQEDTYVMWTETFAYDMEQALGDGWTHIDAQNLYTAVTLDLEFESPEDHDLDAHQLNLWRDGLLDSVRELYGRSGDVD